MERAKQLETKLECERCGRYGTRGFDYWKDPGGKRRVFCSSHNACTNRVWKLIRAYPSQGDKP